MPPLDKALEDEEFTFKLLIYGPSQSRKTLWAGKAAEAGFNVLYLDGDGNGTILRNIAPEFQKNILYVNALDKIDNPVYWPFITRIFKSGKFAWDEQEKTYRASPQACNPEHSHIVFDIKKLDKNVVLIVDSYTAMANSVRWNNAILHGIDLANVEKLDWDIYGPDGVSLNWWLPIVKTLPCHVIVIGHVVNAEKRSADGKTIISSRKQPISSSNAHSLVLSKYFTDVYDFSLAGSFTRIDTKASEVKEGGSRFIPPDIYTFENGPKRLLFCDLIDKAKITSPGLKEWQSPAAIYYPAGVTPIIPGQNQAAPKPSVITTNSATPEKVELNTGLKPSGGLKSILSKKAAVNTEEKKS